MKDNQGGRNVGYKSDTMKVNERKVEKVENFWRIYVKLKKNTELNTPLPSVDPSAKEVRSPWPMSEESSSWTCP